MVNTMNSSVKVFRTCGRALSSTEISAISASEMSSLSSQLLLRPLVLRVCCGNIPDRGPIRPTPIGREGIGDLDDSFVVAGETGLLAVAPTGSAGEAETE